MRRRRGSDAVRNARIGALDDVRTSFVASHVRVDAPRASMARLASPKPYRSSSSGPWNVSMGGDEDLDGRRGRSR